MTGERAWFILAVSIVGYEIAAPTDQLLSQAVDRWIARHPIVTRTVIAAVALHLANALPTMLDPLAGAARLARR